ncbi:LamG domain-containing protein [Candidatus Woesearchaeota archaeon]|nr:LamG domain-containing protein [Candidatus Woesearchaeota archaeon]
MKKAISPLIATILIVGFTIVLAALVMRWTGTFFTTTTTETSEASEAAITCVSDIQFSVQDSCIEGNKIKLLIKNEGQDIQSFIVQVAGTETQTTETLTGLSVYASDYFLANYTSIPFASLPNEIERVRIFPKILVNGEEQVCKEISYTPFNLHTCVDEDTVAYWSFDGDARDGSGNGNDGTINGNPEYEEGVIGDSIHLINNGDYVEVINPSSVLDVSEFSVEAWVNFDMPTTDYYSFLVSRDLDPDVGPYTLFIAEPTTAIPKAAFYSVDLGVVTSTVPLRPGWNHIMGTFDGTKLNIYSNGVLTSQLASGTLDYTDAPFYIGSHPTDITVTVIGKIDEVRISNIARTL